ncbi:hypothetical protein HNQ92_001370 [Rhabdobacter roseus]|uniref:DUF5683 domain-containing protein n=1 Tax=Rhabdobacter roseus TaxID=1655419 RepID=A0A840TIF0_9BACT|nr:hypothetical protein [Rhabdobacter roseus]MBB5283244.1 hypothetical protein [Rhabdobacter roseus]
MVKPLLLLLFLGLLIPALAQDNPSVSDTLLVRRRAFSSTVYQAGQRVAPQAVRALYREQPEARQPYLWGRALQPWGPLVSVSGLALGYVALKGKSASTELRYNGEIITANYTIRSRPQLAAGLALFVGGICLLELSNDLIARSAQRYNVQLKRSPRTTLSLQAGITPSGNLGLYARF